MGLIDRRLWDNRRQDPASIEAEFRGDKGRTWLMRWLPARAHDNGVFYVFSNGVGVDDDEVRTGNAIAQVAGVGLGGTVEFLERLALVEVEPFKKLYRAAEADTGYLRDRNVFRDDIDIHDQMSVNVRYRTGEVLTYSLTCYSPREGMRVCFNGDRGRIEYHEFIGTHMNRAVRPKDFKLDDKPGSEAEGEWIRVFPHFKPSYVVPMPVGSGPHGGADEILCRNFFGGDAHATDSLGRFAGHEQGAASILTGIAGVESIKTNKPVNVTDLVPLKPEAKRLSELV
jgi:hypothetical protein